MNENAGSLSTITTFDSWLNPVNTLFPHADKKTVLGQA